MKKFKLNILTSFLFFAPLFAQDASDWVYDDTVLPEVHINLHPDSLAYILDAENANSYREFRADFILVKASEADTVENIGFRLRGNTSRSSQKKSFKVSFNTFEGGRQYRGLDKLNLNGEHNDPSIIRSKLSWDIFQTMGMVASRANHVKLYINNDYFGLYINVEHIDDKFLERHFNTDEGNLYKCLYGATLTYRGPNPNDYKYTDGNRRVYDLTNNEEADDYSDLAYFINFLNNADNTRFENEIEDYLNVDAVLRWMAVDALTASWDDYWFLGNNYYLYRNPKTQRFEFIPYDYDNTFGIWWTGIYPGIDWGTRDIENWGHPDQDRPLTRRLLLVDEYRKRYHFYVKQTMELAFSEAAMFPSIDRLKAMTTQAAEDDLYRTLDYNYSISDYHNSFTDAIGGHLTYGLKPFITTRIQSALEQVDIQNIAPVFRRVSTSLNPEGAEYRLMVTAEVLDEQVPEVMLYINEGSVQLVLKDDGIGEDDRAGDGVFSGSYLFGSNFSSAQIYLLAVDNELSSSRYPHNPVRTLSFEKLTKTETLFINEFMADNETGIQDESGAFEDWIELYNPSSQARSTAGYYLTDDMATPEKWALPDTTIQPNSFLLIWADNDDEEGALHTNFGLNNDGEEIGLFFKDILETLLVDSIRFGPQADDISFGRQSDGDPIFVQFTTPTPGNSNGILISVEDETEFPQQITLQQNYPNPFNPETVISFRLSANSMVKLEVFDLTGRKIATLLNKPMSAGNHSLNFDGSQLSSGVYVYRLEAGGAVLAKKMILVK